MFLVFPNFWIVNKVIQKLRAGMVHLSCQLETLNHHSDGLLGMPVRVHLGQFTEQEDLSTVGMFRGLESWTI